MQIKETKNVWMVLGNTDLTEGRGRSLVLHVCETKETAIRLGKGRYVMGSDCPVEKTTAVRVGYRWLAPVEIEPESSADKDLRIKREQRELLMKKMREQGFSEEEIAILGK